MINRDIQCCSCGLPLSPPPGYRCWRPDLGEDPGPQVRAVTLYGRDPGELRVRRLDDDPPASAVPAARAWWVKAVGDPERVVPMPWRRVGLCPAETPHAVVAVHRTATGMWGTSTAAAVVQGW